MVMGYGLPNEFVFSAVSCVMITSYHHHVLYRFQNLLPYALA